MNKSNDINGSDDELRFLSLALCGEAGELANIIKKPKVYHTLTILYIC